MNQTIIHGDCVDVMRGMEPESFDAIVTDPPYGLEFMGKEWDKFKATGSSTLMHIPKDEGRTFTNESGHMWDNTKVLPRFPRAGEPFQRWCEGWASEAIRILKPGAHLLAFGGPRTFHRLTCGLEDAGFEIRDCLSWMFGTGFPKSLNIGDGRGTALKPGWEPCVVARKPLVGTVAANVTTYGTGALNIDATRIGTTKRVPGTPSNASGMYNGGWGARSRDHSGFDPDTGRWPANVALDEDAAAMLDAQSGERAGGHFPAVRNGRSLWAGNGGGFNGTSGPKRDMDGGGASRFFYTAKASRAEREAWGRLQLPAERRTDGRTKDTENPCLRTSERVNRHPTVKPLALMEWLIKLVTPPGGLLLDPFVGSGTSLVAARKLGVQAIGIEQDERSVEIARQRIEAQWEVTLL